MREILFRAKRKDNGKWVEGYYVPHIVGGKIVHHYILTGEASLEETKDDSLVLDFYREEIAPETLCQYTGLTDKNGRKIWENDILDIGEKTKLRVSWHTFKASWVVSKSGWMFNHFFGESIEPEDVEVVGNVFDNPELLEISDWKVSAEP